MHKTERKVKRFIWLGALLCFLASNANGCTLMMMNVQKKRDPNAPQSVDWDLSQDNEIKRLDNYTLNKFARLKTDATAYEDGIHLTLHLPGNRTFDEDLSSVICWRHDRDSDKVRHIDTYFPAMTIEEIERTGDRLIKYWNFDRRNFDNWCRERRGVIPEDDERLGMDKSFKSGFRGAERPDLYMEVYHYQADRWRLTWKVYWSPDKAE
jgi:hypothetical protein